MRELVLPGLYSVQGLLLPVDLGLLQALVRLVLIQVAFRPSQLLFSIAFIIQELPDLSLIFFLLSSSALIFVWSSAACFTCCCLLSSRSTSTCSETALGF